MVQVNAKDILYMLAKEFFLERESTEERLVLQKTIYLLQTYGLTLGYGFSWYKYGPYSNDLVKDAYEVLNFAKSAYEQKTKNLKFDASCSRKFDDFKKICGDAIGDPAKLELIASVDFARTTWYPDVNEATFISQFISERKCYLYDMKTRVTEPKVKQALNVVKKLRANAN